MKNSMKKLLHNSIVSAIYTVAMLTPLVISADDIDIYSPSADAAHRPKVMIMLDTSTSMNEKARAWQMSRLDRIKTPIQDFFKSASGVDVGLSTFNGVNRGGSILYPAINLNTDLCPNASCESITIRNQIKREDDDGHEISTTGLVNLTSGGASLGGRIQNRGQRSYYSDAGGQTVFESQSQFGEVEVLPISVTEYGESGSIGLHFPTIKIPENAQVHKVYIQFQWAGQEWLSDSQGGGVGKTRIYMDSRVASPAFEDTPGKRIGDRPKTTSYVTWNAERPDGWNGPDDLDRSVRTSNFQEVFNEVFDNNQTTSATVIIEPDPTASLTANDTVNLLGNHTRNGEEQAPRLVYGFTYDPYEPTYEIAARRFDELNIPKGATIESAHVEFSYRGGTETEEAFLQIRAEDSGNSPPLLASYKNITDRTRTTAYVDWDVPLWRPVRERHKSPDISNVIQEIVDKEDWCAGNALTLILQGTGERYTYMHRKGKDLASSIHIKYDPESVDRNSHCTILNGGNIDLYHPSDELIEERAGELVREKPLYVSNVDRYYAMRFENIDLGAEDIIGNARLKLTQNNDTDGAKTIRVYVDVDTGNNPLSTDVSLSSRFSENYLQWIQIPATAGFRTESVDISSLIQSAIQDTDWERGSALTIGIRIPARNAHYQTMLGDAGEGPTLSIARRVTGSEAANIPFRTARDEITEKIDLLLPFGNTPFVDSFFETALYLTGGPVVHGKRRGEQEPSNSVHRLSSESSYLGGTVTRPTGCYAEFPESESCAGEFISGEAVYNAPDSVECKPNQIVLVTDGAPTESPAGTASAIRTLTGNSSCTSENAADACAVELASWLSTGDDTHHPIQVSTIGFDFSSTFLDAIATAGDGSSYSVASSGQVSEALRQIGENAVFSIGSITAPNAPVDQYSRSSHSGDLYFGLFQPELANPLWKGNIKKYHLGALSDGSIGVVDADGNPVADTTTGEIKGDARSAWTLYADGGVVANGGAAKQLEYVRNVFTSTSASNGTNSGSRDLVPFSVQTEAILATDLGVTPEERSEAIEWMRGQDTRDLDNDGVLLEARKDMGAAIHTTPGVLVFDGGDEGDDKTVVFAGTQEGYLHAIDADTGRELWSYLPYELYENVGTFYRDSPGNSFRYGLDGGLNVRFEDLNHNGIVDGIEKAYVTVGMRRGGEHYYTLDVSNLETPSLAWTIDSSREGYGDLGQTWSKPVSTYIPYIESGELIRKKVLVFANGYRPINDLDQRSSTADHSDKGAIYIADDASGDILYKFDVDDHSEMVWSIPSDVFVVDKDLDGDADVIFTGDLGGNLWRVDIGITRNESGVVATARPSLSLAARLADRPTSQTDPTALTAVGGDRRFFHSPDVAIIEWNDGQRYFGVSIGSGRRDNPTLTDTNNRLYFMRIPMNVDDAMTLTEANIQDMSSEETEMDDGKHGWRINLAVDGEKMLGSPVLYDGTLLATTFLPPDDSGTACVPDIGSGRYYAVDMLSAAGVLEDDSDVDPDNGGYVNRKRYLDLKVKGIPPPVTVLISELNTSKPVVMVGLETLEGAKETPARWQTYWVEE